MKRTAGLCLLLAAAGGCMTAEPGATTANHIGCLGGTPPTVPGVMGPRGEPIAMAAPYAGNPPSELAARAMMAQSVPMNLIQQSPYGIMPAGAVMAPAAPPGIVQAGGVCGPNGCAAPAVDMNGPPPGNMLQGQEAPYSRVPNAIHGMMPPGAVAAVGALTGPGANRFTAARTSVRFAAPEGMKVTWYAPSAGGKGGFAASQLDVPGRYNFAQGAIYRLKLSNIPGRGPLELYPTLEVVPANNRTVPFLAHSSVPVVFTEEDLDQVVAGNYLVKVIYLPDPQFQDLAVLGTNEIVSTRLDPGLDPIAEAYRRGSILLVIRMGNIDLEAPNTPAMDAPSPYAAPQANPRPPMPPGPMVPYGALQSGVPLIGPNGPVTLPPPPGMPGAEGGSTQGSSTSGAGQTTAVPSGPPMPPGTATPPAAPLPANRGTGGGTLPDQGPIQPSGYSTMPTGPADSGDVGEAASPMRRLLLGKKLGGQQ